MKGVIPFILLFISLASAQNLEVSGDIFPSYNEKLSQSMSEGTRPPFIPEPQPPTRRTIYSGDIFIKPNPNFYPSETLDDLKKIYKESLKFSHRDRPNDQVGKYYFPMPKPIGYLSKSGETRYRKKLDDLVPVKDKESLGEKQEIATAMKPTTMTEPTTATTTTTATTPTFTTTTETPIATEGPTTVLPPIKDTPPMAPTSLIKAEPIVQSQTLSSSGESQTVNSKEESDKNDFVPEIKTEAPKHFKRKIKQVLIKKIQEEVQEIKKKSEIFGATDECKVTCDDEPDHRYGRICGLTKTKGADERTIKRWSWYRNQCERRCHLAERSSSKHCLLQDVHKRRLKKKYISPKYQRKQYEMDSSSVE